MYKFTPFSRSDTSTLTSTATSYMWRIRFPPDRHRDTETIRLLERQDYIWPFPVQSLPTQNWFAFLPVPSRSLCASGPLQSTQGTECTPSWSPRKVLIIVEVRGILKVRVLKYTTDRICKDFHVFDCLCNSLHLGRSWNACVKAIGQFESDFTSPTIESVFPSPTTSVPTHSFFDKWA